MDEEKTISVTSLVKLMTKEAFVQVEIGGVKLQMSPSEARDVAMNLLECAADSVAALFLVEFSMGRIGVDMSGAGRLLKEFRDWRNTQ